MRRLNHFFIFQKSPNEKPTKLKNDPKLKLQKLESALLNNKIRSPKLPKKIKTSAEAKNLFGLPTVNDYSSEPNTKTIFPNCLASLNCGTVRQSYSQAGTLQVKSQFFVDKTDEPIYAEPFEYQVLEPADPGTSTISRSVHYLVSLITMKKLFLLSIDFFLLIKCYYLIEFKNMFLNKNKNIRFLIHKWIEIKLSVFCILKIGNN